MKNMQKFLENQLVIKRIQQIKKKLGDKLIILTHHYQRKEIVDLGDYRGDSFGLSKTAAEDRTAQYIVFCGVHFMAESAAILARPHQVVQIPDIEAGCWMADMADAYQVENAWKQLTQIVGEKSVMPLVYMNSDAMIKAFCGRNGGAVCTSSNTADAFRWAFRRRDKIFFFPDRYLGQNSCNQIGIRPDEVIVWKHNDPHGGNTEEDIERSKVILWDGYCLVHSRFTVDHVRQMRDKHPGANIVVHPECTEDVVNLADAVGSTSFIVKFVDQAPPQSTIIIGTEINLIQRLSDEYPDKTVLPLHHSLCPNMYKINLENLLYALENIGTFNKVEVEDGIKADARKALDRMLTLSDPSN